MTMQMALEILYDVKFVTLTIGYILIFEKCGVGRLWALVPFIREYKLGVCAGKEEEGRTYCLFVVLSAAIRVILSPGKLGMRETAMILLFFIAASFASFIYSIRIFNGLCQVFGKKKTWIFPFIFIEGLTLMFWGLNSKFVPNKKIMRDEDDEGKSVAVSGVNVDALNEGLTVNIKERTIIRNFKKKYILQDIHLNIPKGHMVLLLGGSGAGKTNFLNAVTGYEQADAQILLDGSDVYNDYSKLKYDIGFVPQQDLIRGNDTVIRTLMDAASIRLPSSMSAKDKRKRVSEVLDDFGLTPSKNTLVEKMSGGQRRRLSIAMDFISDPTLFILDEPDSGLDGAVARSLFEKLRAIANEGKIVIVITHTPDRVADLFDDVIVLSKDRSRTGRLAFYGPVDEAYKYFEATSMEEIVVKINPKDAGGEGRADEYIEKYAGLIKGKALLA
ncbi:ATP-binding cassette domain-containing protein [Butyrivibrio sp. NC2002]|uniref:ATP-binding cassette domain-containing protein n=1 Tax=Butyrivibrio sp. NC2002 TaxID=1410610 RepID=UPI001FA7136E|nr:ABC transporter ATP-binding protein [Butyrivibrio sp. NC2002]